jgi:hypothetical protein
MPICVSGVGKGAAGVGFWALAMPAVISKMATPMPPAMRWIVAVEDHGLDSLEKQPMFFI